ncbi:MAG: 2-C-methyl-D-erythritol 4-phosphate cytidylyltransferase [Gemmatimonadaceae bacterium]|nr:2-C-methyl-D-erythritol 4-phosphate cytidylyltransferase [Gemmatimonadaceae bacterium]
MTADVGVIIVAAGSGSRVGGAELKQFRWIAGKPMLLHSVHTFQERADVGMVVVVLPREHVGDPPPWLFQCDTERLLLSVGGRNRTDSVRNGLEDLADAARIVVIHDAARPLVTATVIERVIAEARRGHGAAAGVPVVDSLKSADHEGSITGSIDRSGIFRVQTPQAYPREMIERAYAAAKSAGVDATDDSALCERLGFPVVIVPGSERALKITEELDFARAEALSILNE